MEFKVESSSKKLLAYFNHIIPCIISILGLQSSRRAMLVKVTRDTPDDHLGSTVPIEWADCYLVVIRPPSRLTPATLMSVTQTLVHEMIHVKQLARGTLKFTDGGKIWAGQYYSNDTNYLDMPWEQDAFAKTEITVRRVLEI